MKDGTRVLFVKFILGRDTLRKYPLNHDQKTNIFSTDIKWNGHGYLVEVIPAIFRFGRFYRIITMPDGSEKEGNLFFENRKYAMLNDTLYVRNGLSKYIEEIEIFNNKRNDCLNELSNLNQEISNNEKEKNKYQEKYDFSNSEIEKLKQGMNSKEKEYNDKI